MVTSCYKLVRYTGVKSWISAYRWQGEQQTLTIGNYPVMSLQNACQRNIEIKRLLVDGIDPKDDKKKTQADNDGSRALDIIAQRWHDDCKAHIAPTTQAVTIHSTSAILSPSLVT